MVSLLPANRTPFEEVLESAFTPDLVLTADPIRHLRRQPNEPLLPWLVWEYGLTEITPYIDDPYRLIEDGILWQRERGTPAALCRALEWVNQTGCIEQEDGVHWAEIQLALTAQPDERTLQAVRKLARLSIPARTRLARIHDDNWDVRRMVLDGSLLDESLLSDWSGVLIDGVVHSFGKHMATGFMLSAPLLRAKIHDIHTSHVRLQDRVLLDYAVFGDRPVFNHPVTAGNIQSGGVRREGAMPQLTAHGFSLDGFTLSESTLDTRFITPRIFEPTEIMLLDDWALGQKPAGGQYRIIDRYAMQRTRVAVTGASLDVQGAVFSHQSSVFRHPRTRRWPVLDAAPESMQSSATSSGEQGLSGIRTGRTWQVGWTGDWDSTTLIGPAFSDAEMRHVTHTQAQSSGIGQTERTDQIYLLVTADNSRADEMIVSARRTGRTWQVGWTGDWDSTTIGVSHVGSN